MTSPIALMSCMRNEGIHVVEWLAYHRTIGFGPIIICSNDCTDGTDEMLIRLEELGLAHHRRNVIPPGVKPQPSAIRHAQAEPLVHASDWVMVFDADEFLFSIQRLHEQRDGRFFQVRVSRTDLEQRPDHRGVSRVVRVLQPLLERRKMIWLLGNCSLPRIPWMICARRSWAGSDSCLTHLSWNGSPHPMDCACVCICLRIPPRESCKPGPP